MYNEDIGENQFSPAEIYASRHPLFPPARHVLFHLRPVSDRNDRNTRQGVADDGVPEPELPGAQIKDDGIGSKYENMAKSWGKIQDYSAVDNIDREEPDKNKEEYESKYTQDDIDLLTEEQQEKAAAAEIASAKTREQEALAELEKALAEARLRGQNATVPPAETDTANIAPPQGAAAPEPSTKRAGL